MPGRLFLLAYHFGPHALTGAHRWNAMSSRLADLGWEVEAITAGPAAAPFVWKPGIRVHALPVPRWLLRAFRATVRFKNRLTTRPGEPLAPQTDVDPATLRLEHPGRPVGLRSRIVRTVDDMAMAHGEAVWSRRAYRYGRRLAGTAPPDLVITTSPPHLLQVQGSRLAAALGVPHVPDFRDPWVLGAPELTTYNAVELRAGERHERQVLRTAALVLFNTDDALRAGERLMAPETIRAMSLPNGYDATGPITSPATAQFHVVFAGWLYPFMDIRPVFAALRRLLDRGRLRSEELRIEFMGPESEYGGTTLSAVASAYGLGDQFALLPRRERAEALALQQRASVLLVFDYPHPFAVPTKFYDHAQLHGTMLLVGTPGGALAAAATRIGLQVHPADDDTGIDADLERAVTRWRSGNATEPTDTDGVFDRQHQSDRLAAALDEVLSRPHSTP